MGTANPYPTELEISNGEPITPVRVSGTTLLIDCDRTLCGSLVCDSDGKCLRQLSEEAFRLLDRYPPSAAHIRDVAEWVRNNCPKQYLV